MNFRRFLENDFAKHGLKQATDALISLVNPLNRKMMPESIPKAHDVVNKYWSDPRFLTWLSQNGVDAPDSMPDYKDGAAGRAYFIGEHVVKFTGNRVEAKIAQDVAGRTDLPTAVLAVLPLDNLFAILQHRVKMGDEIAKGIRDAADWLGIIIDEKPELKGFPSDPQQQMGLIQWLIKNFRAPTELIPFMKQVMTALASLYEGTGFKHDDAGPTNIGVHNNRVVFPDLGPNKTGDFSTDKALQQIQTNRASLGLS